MTGDKITMTYEDVKRIRENPEAAHCDDEELSKLIDLAIEKQIPKRIDAEFAGVCECGKYVFNDENYCPQCGQRLDWGN